MQCVTACIILCDIYTGRFFACSFIKGINSSEADCIKSLDVIILLSFNRYILSFSSEILPLAIRNTSKYDSLQQNEQICCFSDTDVNFSSDCYVQCHLQFSKLLEKYSVHYKNGLQEK